MMDTIGFAPHDVGKLDESQTIKFFALWVSHRELTTDDDASSPIFAVA
jgi:hypothetical protein